MRSESSSHLAATMSEMYERRWERFYVNRPARLISVKPALSGVSIRSGQVVDISRGGAAIEAVSTTGLGSHYYVQIVGLGARIGAAEVYRNGRRIGVKFIAPISDALLHQIVRAEFLLGEQMQHNAQAQPASFR